MLYPTKLTQVVLWLLIIKYTVRDPFSLHMYSDLSISKYIHTPVALLGERKKGQQY